MIKFVYGFIALCLWWGLFYYLNRENKEEICSNDTWILSTAIVVAGAMMGGV